MRLLKIVSVIFTFYLIRRFIQMYRVMEQIQRERAQTPNPPQHTPNYAGPKSKDNVIEADFKVVDR